MIGRALRIELRRSAAPGAAAVLLVLGAVLFYARPLDWTGRWIGLALTLRSGLFVLGPVALGAGVWLAGRDRRSGMGELMGTTPRPSWQRDVVAVSAAMLALVVAYVLPGVVAAVQVWPVATYAGGAWPAVILVGAVALCAAVCLGMALGRRLPYRLLAPVATVVGFAGGLAVPTLLRRAFPELGPHLVPLQAVIEWTSDIATVPAAMTVAQVLWFGGLAGTGLALLAVRSRRGFAAALVPAGAGLAVAVAWAAPVVPAAADGAVGPLVVDPGAAALVCAEGAPRVCVTRVHAAALPGVVPPARDVLARLARRVPGAPTEAVEGRTLGIDASRDRPGTLTFSLFVMLDARGRVRADMDLREIFARGTGLASCAEPPGGLVRESAAALATGHWLLDSPLPAVPDEDARLALARLRALPAAAQLDRVMAFRAAARDCRSDSLAALLPGFTLPESE